MKVVIIGAGVGGLSVAIALKQKGIDAVIFERQRERADIGAGIVLWPNAVFVLKELELLACVESVSGKLTQMRRVSNRGVDLGIIDIHQLNQRMGFSSLSILRCDLMKILESRALALGVTIHYHHEVDELVSDHSQTAHIVLTNGKRVDADVIIGADGRMNSIARKFVLGANEPVYQGFINWVGVYQSERAVFNDMAVMDFWGVGKRFGIVPVSATKAYWAGGAASSEILAKDPGRFKDELHSLFHKWPDPITELLASTSLNAINKIYVHDHDPVEQWHKNNVILMGDAAHAPLPTSGQGACQALEDAWFLTNSLLDKAASLEENLNSYTALRMAKTAAVTLGGRQLAQSIFNLDVEYCRQRDLNSSKTDFGKLVEGMANGWSSGLPMADAVR